MLDEQGAEPVEHGRPLAWGACGPAGLRGRGLAEGDAHVLGGADGHLPQDRAGEGLGDRAAGAVARVVDRGERAQTGEHCGFGRRHLCLLLPSTATASSRRRADSTSTARLSIAVSLNETGMTGV
ncbi:Uncharacterised protein [Mycobacteroides abscessus subsp. abscessus]|nr:Uncharacterised protein [Mycobacteroides abscessus subsp. abscessus]